MANREIRTRNLWDMNRGATPLMYYANRYNFCWHFGGSWAFQEKEKTKKFPTLELDVILSFFLTETFKFGKLCSLCVKIGF